MALPNRNTDIVISVNGAAPSQSMHVRDWPKALPDALNRIVIAYLDPAVDEVKKLDEHFKQLGNETVAPFRNAIESKVDPLLKRPTMASIYQSKPQKSKWNFVENSTEKLVDDYIKQMSHLPVDEQLDFLCTVYDGDWKREEKGEPNALLGVIIDYVGYLGENLQLSAADSPTFYRAGERLKALGVFRRSNPHANNQAEQNAVVRTPTMRLMPPSIDDVD